MCSKKVIWYFVIQFCSELWETNFLPKRGWIQDPSHSRKQPVETDSQWTCMCLETYTSKWKWLTEERKNKFIFISWRGNNNPECNCVILLTNTLSIPDKAEEKVLGCGSGWWFSWILQTSIDKHFLPSLCIFFPLCCFGTACIYFLSLQLKTNSTKLS